MSKEIVITEINDMEKQKYDLLNQFYYLTKEGLIAEDNGEEDKAVTIAEELSYVIIAIEDLDEELRHVGEMHSFDYKINISVEEV
jgi:hypothetical protein